MADTATAGIRLRGSRQDYGGGVKGMTRDSNNVYADSIGNLVAAESTDGRIRNWLGDKKPKEFGLSPSKKRQIGGFALGALAVAIGGSTGGVSGYLNGVVAVWSLKGKLIRKLEGHKGMISDISFRG